MQSDLIEEWNLSKRELPEDIPCELRQRRGTYVGKFEAHPMTEETRRNWIGDMHHFEGVKGISPNIGHHIGEYNVALSTRDTKLSKSIVNDVATQMMWFAYPDECYDLYYNTSEDQ